MIVFLCITHAQEYEGRVVSVSDGDTITVLISGNQQIKVRLAEIDTSESAQPYGTRSKQKLSDLVFNKTVTVNVSDKDRYGRMIGRVYVDSVDVNATMVEIGAAWVYRQYAKDQSLFSLEEKAKELKLGFWTLPKAERVPLWEWRKLKRNNPTKSKEVSQTQYRAQPPANDSGFTCGGKRTCGQMSSCAEAMFYLKQCGLTRLDRDKDGIPCKAFAVKQFDI